jgi:hypothetical protein
MSLSKLDASWTHLGTDELRLESRRRRILAPDKRDGEEAIQALYAFSTLQWDKSRK